MAKKADNSEAVDDVAPKARSKRVMPVRVEDLPFKGVDPNSIRVPTSPSHTPYSER